jgi:hypothetical protein
MNEPPSLVSAMSPTHTKISILIALAPDGERVMEVTTSGPCASAARQTIAGALELLKLSLDNTPLKPDYD